MGAAQQDRAAMAEAAQRVGDAFDVIVGIKGKLREYKSEALGQWEGNAANAFSRVMDTFDEKFQVVCDALNDLREKMGAARMSYEATEEQQQEAVNKIDALLNGLT
ncbi:WXG100 family type VII secretion target [Thermasporomyces composti]|uniref:ESAT-6-like protein n=1 Tax=Thermasporomyces composti TaxID=696763 RepID=A0A3D9V788_THECX|nr:WXG100 family type VII secretion target [Thermasporomyces composti]REF36563.1 WXG100 family type VII secretion target [Thermasporomyces composti]